MSGSNVFEFDSTLLNSPVRVGDAVRVLYRELRRGRRIVARICGSRSAQAAGWLGYALEQGGVPFTLAHPESGDDATAAERLQIVVSNDPTSIAAVRTPAPSTPLRIVLLGLGTVGLGVYRHLSARPDLFEVRRVVVREVDKHRHDGVPVERLATNLWHAINEPADLVIELVGGVDPAGDVVHAALLRGRTVISANKALIATRWDSFERYVSTAHPRLRFSAAVGGSVPVLENLERFALDRGVESVRAVINGTCNFVLDEIARGATFADAITLAQRRGFAEADPSVDLSGADAAQKLSLIARAAFGTAPDPTDIDCQGIERLTPADICAAQARGQRIRLVASCTTEHGAVRAHVRPEALEARDYLAGARHEENRVEISVATGEALRLAGKGAGRWPTALAVMGDVVDVLESRLAVVTAPAAEQRTAGRAPASLVSR
ncbi:MAG TPA: homoserine dehydrogenase [Steroidobacteraceae bacterium]|nr:homoserine dehydrogenase [Steroidobacteraceae bacterium]